MLKGMPKLECRAWGRSAGHCHLLALGTEPPLPPCDGAAVPGVGQRPMSLLLGGMRASGPCLPAGPVPAVHGALGALRANVPCPPGVTMPDVPWLLEGREQKSPVPWWAEGRCALVPQKGCGQPRVPTVSHWCPLPPSLSQTASGNWDQFEAPVAGCDVRAGGHWDTLGLLMCPNWGGWGEGTRSGERVPIIPREHPWSQAGTGRDGTREGRDTSGGAHFVLWGSSGVGELRGSGGGSCYAHPPFLLPSSSGRLLP